MGPSLVRTRIRFGNWHELDVKPRSATQLKQRHRWVLFVEFEKIPDFLVSSVHFQLTPHMKEDAVREMAPFEVARVGSRPFPVDITVHWKPELRRPPLVLSHTLSFDSDETSSHVEVDLGQLGEFASPFAVAPRRSRASSTVAGGGGAATAARPNTSKVDDVDAKASPGSVTRQQLLQQQPTCRHSRQASVPALRSARRHHGGSPPRDTQC